MSDLTVCVLGLGYIGLPTAVIVAKAGYRVIGVDISDKVVEKVNSGEAHFQEPSLDEQLAYVVGSKQLVAKLTAEPSDIFIICVPTPVMLNDHGVEADMRYVDSVADQITSVVKDGDIVILESTSPVGATDALQRRLNSMLPENVGVTVAARNRYCQAEL